MCNPAVTPAMVAGVTPGRSTCQSEGGFLRSTPRGGGERTMSLLPLTRALLGQREHVRHGIRLFLHAAT
jgi:hypothetical protein